VIVIDYEKFLSKRFDFVLRYHFLEKAGFDSERARILTMSPQYKYLRQTFGELLAMDVGDRRVAKALRMAKVFSDDFYGLYYTDQLFIDYNDRRFPMKSGHDWLWIEEQMRKGEEWIKSKPFAIAINGLALTTKRFVLALMHNRSLYWGIVKVKRDTLNLWKEDRYKELLNSSKFNELEECKGRMLRRMERVRFFSANTYVGNKQLLEKLNEK